MQFSEFEEGVCVRPEFIDSIPQFYTEKDVFDSLYDVSTLSEDEELTGRLILRSICRMLQEGLCEGPQATFFFEQCNTIGLDPEALVGLYKRLRRREKAND